jgi:poly-gamma-glutamate capsule biosynthesis protein CapA/YwtB (metallophosphatase superfamily)
MKKFLACLVCVSYLAACMPATETRTATVTPVVPPAVTATNTPMPAALWMSEAVPPFIRAQASSWNIPSTGDPKSASVKLDVSKNSGSQWIYALVAPFPTVPDGVAYSDLLSAWKGNPAGPFEGRAILMDESTLAAFTALWGEPASGSVRSVAAEKLLDTAWSDLPAWAIIPFEDIQPKWKVLTVDGQSPIRKEFKPDAYPLKIRFALTGNSSFVLPESNRDPSKLATVLLTGVTALVRATALTMELKGITYPGSLVREVMRAADVTHISNEVTFDKSCPYPKGGYTNFILCSKPGYLDLLKDVGVDIVEMTGDHLQDRGVQALLDTLALYKENNIPYYGGGVNEAEARKPVLMDINGNKIAFMGCNGKRKEKYPKAKVNKPGAADCNYDFFVKQVKEVKAQGYMVIFTFQHEECYSSGPCFTQEKGFHAVADAGATIVSGSQAHFPELMEFRGDSFIHFGLGNMFFDQMSYILPDGQVIDGTRREFMDRHVFYNGKYLGVELITSMLEDYARPRPMTADERARFLSDYFYFSGWTTLAPTPVPQPTVTLTPIALP